MKGILKLVVACIDIPVSRTNALSNTRTDGLEYDKGNEKQTDRVVQCICGNADIIREAVCLSVTDVA